MDQPLCCRRGFLSTVGCSIAAGGLHLGPAIARSAPQTHPIRLGAPIPKPPADPEELARAYRRHGYRAAYCPPVKLGDSQRIQDLQAAFQRHDVVIAEVGRWCNLLDPDADKRAANLKTVTDGLALAEAIGARCCVDIAGSFNPKVWFGPHPKNLSREFFDAAVENARKIIDAVRPRRTKFAYEMMGWALPDSPESYLQMIKAVDRPAFGVHLDPCNLVQSPKRFYETTALLNECFDKLGPWIASCHAKDVAWSDPVEMQVHLLEVPLGKGVLDYSTYLRRLAALPGDVPLMIEHLKTPEQYEEAREYVVAMGKRVGVRFE